ncbi:MAG: LacI family DNA-binding transcriptional regulator [Kiritimatiellae bacterium]|nr:LacI family DNA-binding transcriptional regulator [Kiritimatiellia bacterium]
MRTTSGKVSLRDIAQQLHISTAAVSKALNDLPGVSDALRLKVKKTAERMGYSKYLRSSMLNTYERSMKFIVLLYGRIGGHLIEQIQRGVDTPIRRKGYCELRYLIDVSQELHAEEIKELFLGKIWQEKGVAGVLACYLKLSDVLLAKIYDHNLPVVMLENHTDFGRCVTIDNVKASHKAASRLLALGRRTIACVMPPEDVDHVWHDRLDGYKKALKEHGLKYDPSLIAHGKWVNVAEGEEATAGLLKSRPGVDAILFGSDIQAYGGIKALREAGRRIPDDVAVIGFDDMEYNEAMVPRLSSIRQPITKMAETGLNLLFDSIEKGDLSHRAIVMDTELILRDSA